MKNKTAIYVMVFVLIAMSDNAIGLPNVITTFRQTAANRVGFGSGQSVASSVDVQSNGKYLTSGLCEDGSEPWALCVIRWERNGEVDPTFGIMGTAKLLIGGNWWSSSSLVIGNDDKAIIGGDIHLPSHDRRAALVRLNPNGSLDQTFGSAGGVIILGESISAISLQPDGKIITCGNRINGQDDQLVISRFNQDGTIDQDYGTDGRVFIAFGPAGTRSFGNAVDVQNDGKIVVAGTHYVFEFPQMAVARVLPDGVLDTSFGTAGKLIIPFGSSKVNSRAINAQSDGKVVVLGDAFATQNEAAIARLRPDGTLDTDFDVDGKVTWGSTASTIASSMSVDDFGRIITTGGITQNGVGQSFIARFRPDGRLDEVFNGGGVVKIEGLDTGNSIITQTDGNITIAGSKHPPLGQNQQMMVSRVNESGGLDMSFGFNGISSMNAGDQISDGWATAIQPDGKILVAGSTGRYPRERSVLTRFNTDGSLDPTFAAGGKMVLDLGMENRFTGISVLPDGKLLATGYVQDQSDLSGAVLIVRFNKNGILDTTFDSDGIVTHPIGYAKAMSLQSDGKIVIVGESTFFDMLIVARFDQNGALDPGFNKVGFQTISFGNVTERLLAVTIQYDGKIVACGYTANGDDRDAAIARLNTDGTLDATFGTAGKVVTDFGNGNDVQYAVAATMDGKILTAGRSGPESAMHTTLVRYRSDGSLDPTFGIGGRSVSAVDSSDEAHAIVLQPDGKILIAGTSRRVESQYPDYSDDLTILRFLPEGDLDLSFGDHGIIKDEFTTSSNVGWSITTDKEGDIVVAGNAGGLLCVARFSDQSSGFALSGRVLDASGNAIRQAEIKITDSAGPSQTTSSSSFGYYGFENVAPGQITIIAKSRRYVFSDVTISLTSNVQDIDLIAAPDIIRTTTSSIFLP